MVSNGKDDDVEMSYGQRDAVFLKKQNGAFQLSSFGHVDFYEKRAPFSWKSLFMSPMILMGAATIFMMLIMQFMMQGMDLDELRKELRNENDDDKENTAEKEERETKKVQGNSKKKNESKKTK